MKSSGYQLEAAKRCSSSSFASHATCNVATKSAATIGNDEGQKESQERKQESKAMA